MKIIRHALDPKQFYYIMSIFCFISEDNISKKCSRDQNSVNERCLADELKDALRKESLDEDADDDVFLPTTSTQNTDYPKFSSNFIEDLRQVPFSSVSKNTRAYLNSDNQYLLEDSTSQKSSQNVSSAGRQRKDSSDGEGMY